MSLEDLQPFNLQLIKTLIKKLKILLKSFYQSIWTISLNVFWVLQILLILTYLNKLIHQQQCQLVRSNLNFKKLNNNKKASLYKIKKRKKMIGIAIELNLSKNFALYQKK